MSSTSSKPNIKNIPPSSKHGSNNNNSKSSQAQKNSANHHHTPREKIHHSQNASSTTSSSSTSISALDSYAEQILSVIQPTVESERKRMGVVQSLCTLFEPISLKPLLFGSVAFKTYLPDGDIDMSVFVRENDETGFPWHAKVRQVFKQRNEGVAIRDTVFIDAEVKLIKCVVNDVPIDLSCNQVGGICTLCFLEEVDRMIKKDHLFKRSVILIKAWCYYESRILASHHSLLSTYAVTVLIMYIFNKFYSELHTPLQVLYRFLEIFSEFDWENYGISVHGPISLAALPKLEIVNTEKIEDLKKNMVLNKQFTDSCQEQYGNVGASQSTNGEQLTFSPKYLNVVDPLRDYNNLGRSVSKNSFMRIRRAFKKGYKSISDILNGSVDPSSLITSFFKNTYLRNQKRKTSFSTLNIPGQSPSTSMALYDGSLSPSRSIEIDPMSLPTPSIHSSDIFNTNFQDYQASLKHAKALLRHNSYQKKTWESSTHENGTEHKYPNSSRARRGGKRGGYYGRGPLRQPQEGNQSTNGPASITNGKGHENSENALVTEYSAPNNISYETNSTYEAINGHLAAPNASITVNPDEGSGSSSASTEENKEVHEGQQEAQNDESDTNSSHRGERRPYSSSWRSSSSRRGTGRRGGFQGSPVPPKARQTSLSELITMHQTTKKKGKRKETPAPKQTPARTKREESTTT